MFGNELRSVTDHLNDLERRSLQRRRRNYERIEGYVARYGPRRPGPRLESLPPNEDNRRLKLLAELHVLKFCLTQCKYGAHALRQALKRERGTVGSAIVWESELARFLRAKNRKIGQTQVWLDSFLGSDPSPVSQWGRGAHPPEGAAYDAVRLARNECGVRIVAPGAPPAEPEFRPDALLIAHERRCVERLAEWLPRVMAKRGARDTVALEGVLGELRNCSCTTVRQADEALRQIKSRSRSIEADRGAAWRVACRDTKSALRSSIVRAVLQGQFQIPMRLPAAG